MSELAKKIVKELLDNDEFVNSCHQELKVIFKDNKFDAKDMPSVLSLVVLTVENYESFQIEEKDVVEVFRLLIVELLTKLDLLKESNDEIDKMIETCLKLLAMKVKTKSFWKKYFGWCICKCCKK